MSKSFAYICFLLLVFVLASCRVEKRVYRKGYHVVWNHKRVEGNKPRQVIKILQPVEEEVPATVVVSSDNTLSSLKPKPTLLLKDTCGDKLLLQNAEELIVKVMEVDDQYVKYKRCDNLDGPLYSISKNKVAVITYVNGVKEVVIQEAPLVKAKEKPVNDDSRRTNIVGLVSFYCSTVGILLFFLHVVAIPLAIVSMYQFKRNPDKYKNSWMPRASLIISMVFCFFVASGLMLLTSVPGTPFVSYMIAAAIFALLGFTAIWGLCIKKK